MTRCTLLVGCLLAIASAPLHAEHDPHPYRADGVTSLVDERVEFTVPKGHRVRLSRGGSVVDIVDNAEGDEVIAEHRAGYNGIAAWRVDDGDHSPFVPRYAGLNFEHIHDGTLELPEKFEPRRASMQLRVVDEHTVEVYQPPTPNWGLESCGRYRLLEDGVVEYTFECIPRRDSFANRTIGLFWASYIQQPRDGAIHFAGRRAGTDDEGEWQRTVTPRHGVDATHPPAGVPFRPRIHPDFPLTLVNHPSPREWTEPWYYGRTHGMAVAFVFRRRDHVWFAQSPSGGGTGNPAWDFQWFVPRVKVGEAYGFTMRALYVPFSTRGKLELAIGPHERALNPPRDR